MTSFYDNAYFNILKNVNNFVGDAIKNAQSVVQGTRQIPFLNGRKIWNPIKGDLKWYASSLDLLDEDKLDPIDIVSICHSNKEDITKKQKNIRMD